MTPDRFLSDRGIPEEIVERLLDIESREQTGRERSAEDEDFLIELVVNLRQWAPTIREIPWSREREVALLVNPLREHFGMDNDTSLEDGWWDPNDPYANG